MAVFRPDLAAKAVIITGVGAHDELPNSTCVALLLARPLSSEQTRSALAAEIKPGAQPYVVELLRSGGTQVLSVEMDVDGIPMRLPLRRELVDATTGEVLLSMEHAPRGPWLQRPVVVTESDAVRLVEASGLAGSKGAMGAQLVADPQPNQTVAAWRVDPPYSALLGVNSVFLVDAFTGQVRPLGDRSAAVNVRAFDPNPVLNPGGSTIEVESLAGGVVAGPRFVCTPPSLTFSFEANADLSAEAQADFRAWLEGFRVNFSSILAARAEGELIIAAAGKLGASAGAALNGAVMDLSTSGNLKAKFGARCALLELPIAASALADSGGDLKVNVDASIEVIGAF